MKIYFPFIILQIGTLIFWWILWLFCYPRGLRSASGDSSTSSFVRGCVLMLFLGFFIGWAVHAPRYYWPRARIVSQEAHLYVGPEKDFPKRALLSDSEQIVIEQKKEGWYYVSTSQGKGWVQATDVALEGDTHDLT